MSVCLGLWMVLSKLLQPLQYLIFFTALPGELARVFHVGLATQGSTNGTGCSSSGAVATMSSSLHGENIFYFNALPLLLVLLCFTDKYQEKLDIEALHHSNIGIQIVAIGSFLVITFLFQPTALVWLRSIVSLRFFAP